MPSGSLQSIEISVWHGRLAVTVQADSEQSPARSFVGDFELSGSAAAGRLVLYSPLGMTVASLNWTPTIALLRSGGEFRAFESLDALITQTLGTEVPVTALFAWLAGESTSTGGWNADLSQRASGHITARRTSPSPAAEIRLILER